MENFGWIEVLSLLAAVVALAFSIFYMIMKMRLNRQLERRIIDHELEKSIEKMIRIRNANSKIKSRTLSEKEVESLMNKLEMISKELDESKRRYFEDTWYLKNQRDKLNYLMKLIKESSVDSEFKKIEKVV